MQHTPSVRKSEVKVALIDWRISLGLIACLALAACNVFEVFRSPNGNDQTLSAARGCLDQGDLECARREYAKLAGTPYAEQAASELAFAYLEEAGAGAAILFPALARGSSSGEKLTNLANGLAPSKGRRQRALIYQGYQQVASITTNTNLRGLVRFTSSFALAAAILAEEVGPTGRLRKSDYLTSTACSTATCAVDANCDDSDPHIVPGPAITITASPPPELTVFDVDTPTWGMYQAALNGIQLGVNEVQATGNLAAGTGDLAVSFSTLDSSVSTADRCFRAENLAQGIGSNE
jgi:hypothetical protein